MKKIIILAVALISISLIAFAWAQAPSRCFVMNSCQGDSFPCESIEKCISEGGSSWKGPDGTCVKDLSAQ